MKKTCKHGLVIFFYLVFLLGIQPAQAQNEKPFVIPELKEWIGKQGQFTPSLQPKIVCDMHNETLKKVALQFAADYKLMFNKKTTVAEGKASAGDFILKMSKNKNLGDEGYTIDINSKVIVTASTAIGLYWGTRTLLQLSEQQVQHKLPKGTIRDYPNYSLRGFMMDCGRKFIPMTYLKDLVKIMAYYKMNTLQIHLNDNGFKQFYNHDWDKTYSAFRLECDTYPGLTARDGFYTKTQFREFQKEAAALNVEIIPEIDAPAHTLAFTHYKPEIGSKEYGMDHLDLFNPETYRFMDGLFNEYLEGENPVFYGPKVHIGTDEYSNKDKKVVEKFRAFTDRYINLVESYGKQACIWGALTHANGETPVKSENVIMSAWYNGYAEPKEMVKQGYKLISIPDGQLYIVPATSYYHDYLDLKHLYADWTPAHIGNVTFEEKDPAILGGMFAVWNDHVGNGISVKDIHHRLFPSLQTLSTKMWRSNEVTIPFEEFNSKRMSLSEAPAVNQLGRIGNGPELVYQTDKLQPGMKLPYTEIGYDYTISFDIDNIDNEYGTELFRSPNAVFYLSDPVTGNLGFVRDGYLNSFNFRLNMHEMTHIEIQGNNESTLLKVNGKVIANLDKEEHYFDKGKSTRFYIRTLVFPLQKAGNFKSSITNFKVYNYQL